MNFNTTLYVEYRSSDKSAHRPVMVFFHGWGLHADIWSQVCAVQVVEFDLLLLDLPGMGRSPNLTNEFTLDTVCEQIALALESFRRRRLHLVGWSLGAVIAAQLVKTRMNEFNISSLTTISLGPWFLQSERRDGMDSDQFRLFCALLEEDFEGTIFRFLSLNTKGSQQQRREIRLLQQIVFMHGFPDRKSLRGGLEILENFTLEEFYRRPPLPCQIILGERDSLVPISFETWFTKHCPDVQVSVIKNSGHVPFLGDPHGVCDQLSMFVAGIK